MYCRADLVLCDEDHNVFVEVRFFKYKGGISMAEMLEIRWHGRGGQGAKTASLLLADASSSAGKYIQAFPEYGPERMGAPVTSYTRISDEPITLHSGVEAPKYVVVLDATFVGRIDFTKGVPDGGAIIINTPMTAKQMREEMGFTNDKVQIYVVDANRISEEHIGRAIPNTPMLGALIKATGVMTLESLVEDTRAKLSKKFRGRDDVIEGNVKSIVQAYEEVRGE